MSRPTRSPRLAASKSRRAPARRSTTCTTSASTRSLGEKPVGSPDGDAPSSASPGSAGRSSTSPRSSSRSTATRWSSSTRRSTWTTIRRRACATRSRRSGFRRSRGSSRSTESGEVAARLEGSSGSSRSAARWRPRYGSWPQAECRRGFQPSSQTIVTLRARQRRRGRPRRAGRGGRRAILRAVTPCSVAPLPTGPQRERRVRLDVALLARSPSICSSVGRDCACLWRLPCHLRALRERRARTPSRDSRRAAARAPPARW